MADETYRVVCVNCQQRLKIPKSAIGRTVKCPACETVFVVQVPSEVVEESLSEDQPPHQSWDEVVEAPTMSGTSWYYVDSQQLQIGPIASPELKRLASTGTIRRDDLVWRNGLKGWIKASDVKGLFPAAVTSESAVPVVGAPPPPPPVPTYSEPFDNSEPFDMRVNDAELTLMVNYADVSPYAGFWKRFAAILIDLLITQAATLVIFLVFGFAMAVGGANEVQILLAGNIAGNIIGIIIWWLYAACMESSQLQGSLGKLALGIKVTDLNGQRIGFGRATGRHFAAILSGIVFGIGFFMAAFTERKQALHDQIASCLVLNRQTFEDFIDSLNDEIIELDTTFEDFIDSLND